MISTTLCFIYNLYLFKVTIDEVDVEVGRDAGEKFIEQESVNVKNIPEGIKVSTTDDSSW